MNPRGSSVSTLRRGWPTPLAPVAFLAVIAFLALLAPLAGCARRAPTLQATGWAYALPPPGRRDPAAAARVRDEADRTRIAKIAPWAAETLEGRGTATASPEETGGDAALAELLARARAREAARRHLAERVAALPAPRRAPGGALAAPPPLLGDPGALAPEAAARLSDWIARAGVTGERHRADGRYEAAVALPLLEVARLALGEPAAAAPAPPPARESRAPAPVSPRGAAARSFLPPVSGEEFLAAATAAAPEQADSAAWPTPQARAEARRRAETHARAWLLEAVRRRSIHIPPPRGRRGAKSHEAEREPIDRLMALLPEARRIVMDRVQTAPIAAAGEDALGRQYVTLKIDFRALEADLRRAMESPSAHTAAPPPLP